MMSVDDFLLIAQSMEGGGSGTGNSFYGHTCPRRARLSAHKDEDAEDSEAIVVGSVFHKLMELWRTDQIPSEIDATGVLGGATLSPALKEAARLYNAYTDWFGDNDGKPADFRTMYVERKIENSEIFGVPFTMRVDAIVQPLQMCVGLRGVELDPDKWYILDYKTTKMKYKDQEIRDSLSPQFQAYPTVWNATDPVKVAGVIVDRIVRYKELDDIDKETNRPKAFATSVLGLPTDAEVEALRRYYGWKHALMSTNYCNLAACTFPSVCPYAVSGVCNRISEEGEGE